MRKRTFCSLVIKLLPRIFKRCLFLCVCLEISERREILNGWSKHSIPAVKTPFILQLALGRGMCAYCNQLLVCIHSFPKHTIWQIPCVTGILRVFTRKENAECDKRKACLTGFWGKWLGNVACGWNSQKLSSPNEYMDFTSSCQIPH